MQEITHSLSRLLCALSLSDAVDAWGQASQIKLEPGTNYPNQLERNPGSHLSCDPSDHPEELKCRLLKKFRLQLSN